MPTPLKITARTSTITNSFVTSIIPSIYPSEEEAQEALNILGQKVEDLRCVYCGDNSTEWDHLRPLGRRKRPTGYISEIANLVPSCGKCNQSKGCQEWETWMLGPARLSPTSRKVPDLQRRIRKLKTFESWGRVLCLDFQSIVGSELWDVHWRNNRRMHELMAECQTVAESIRLTIVKSLPPQNNPCYQQSTWGPAHWLPVGRSDA